MDSFVQRHTGWIEVICGSMFSGKTEELIRRVRRSQIARQKVELFKPSIDTRYSINEIVSHDSQKLPSRVVKDANEIIALSLEAQVVAIDEAQFYKKNLVKVAKTLANMGKRVIIAGLDMDYRGEAFQPIPELLAIAEKRTQPTRSYSVLLISMKPGAEIVTNILRQLKRKRRIRKNDKHIVRNFGNNCSSGNCLAFF